MSSLLGRRTLLIGLAAGAGSAALGSSALAASFRAVSHTWAPWNLDPPGARATSGIAARMARAVFDTAGLSVDMTILPWQRCLNELRLGRRQLGWSVVRTPEREEYLAYSRPLWLSSNRVFAATNNPTLPWRDWQDLVGSTLGVVRGYGYGIDLDLPRAAGVRIEVVSSEDYLLSMLHNGRINAFIMDWQTYRHLLRRQGMSETAFVASDLPMPEMSYHIVASRASPEAVATLPLIDAAIDALRGKGTLDTLLREGLDPALPPTGTKQSRLPPA